MAALMAFCLVETDDVSTHIQTKQLVLTITASLDSGLERSYEIREDGIHVVEPGQDIDNVRAGVCEFLRQDDREEY